MQYEDRFREKVRSNDRRFEASRNVRVSTPRSRNGEKRELQERKCKRSSFDAGRNETIEADGV